MIRILNPKKMPVKHYLLFMLRCVNTSTVRTSSMRFALIMKMCSRLRQVLILYRRPGVLDIAATTVQEWLSMPWKIVVSHSMRNHISLRQKLFVSWSYIIWQRSGAGYLLSLAMILFWERWLPILMMQRMFTDSVWKACRMFRFLMLRI